jgi:hypothetical protein
MDPVEVNYLWDNHLVFAFDPRARVRRTGCTAPTARAVRSGSAFANAMVALPTLSRFGTRGRWLYVGLIRPARHTPVTRIEVGDLLRAECVGQFAPGDRFCVRLLHLGPLHGVGGIREGWESWWSWVVAFRSAYPIVLISS